jgi:hypothetical protein
MQSFRLFLEHRDTPVLFIDLDGTLVHTSYRPKWSELLLPTQLTSKRSYFESLRDIRLRFLSMPLEEQLTIMQKLGGTPVRHQDIQAVTFLRPGARDFLVACMGIAHTCILTQGDHDLQEKVVAALDIPVRELYGNRGEGDYDVNYGSRVPQSPSAILVDDMPQESALVQRKLKAMGLPNDTDRFIEIKTWEGVGGDPGDYGTVLGKIRQLVKSAH